MKNRIKNISKALILVLPLVGASGSFCSCNDWLNLLPNNEKVTERYWESKEDVENVIASGYYYMRESVPILISWGELRGGDFYYMGSGSAEAKLQDFDMLPTNSLCSYEKLYQVISMANSVLDYAPAVRDKDKTYYEAMMKSHLCEAYFMRAWAYTILVKNYKEVPLVTIAYVNDDAPLYLPKASESAIIAQIKEDVASAIALGAAKGHYEEDWQTKGRATKWALYALGADICLWNHDFDECISYADKLIDADDALRPVFVTETSKWFEIFYPGLSNGSIFEVYWDYNTENKANNFTGKFSTNGNSVSGKLNFTPYATEKIMSESMTASLNYSNDNMSTTGRVGRMSLATYSVSMLTPALWKYIGTDVEDMATVRVNNDANFILYRMADVMLMKAEALIMKGESHWKSAIELINKVRTRAYVGPFIDLEASDADNQIASMDQSAMLTEVLDQREMEFFGEGHRWYDILRLARYDKTFAPDGTIEDEDAQEYENYHTNGFGDEQFEYKKMALSIITQSNNTTSTAQLESVLQNSWAWYLPLAERELECNPKLNQNPYYE